MTDNTTLIELNAFIVSHTRVIRDLNIITDVDLAELFEVDVEAIRHLTATNLPKFKDESMIMLSADEMLIYQHVRFAFTDPGIFTLAGLIKTKRSIRIYVKLIELLVSRLQNRAYEIATNYPANHV